MNRRMAIEKLVGGVVSAGLMVGSPLFGQGADSEGRVRIGAGGGAPQQGPQQPNTAVQQTAAAQVEVQMSPEVMQLLQLWEKHTAGIERLQGNFQRYVYDSTFYSEKRADGSFWFERPDKGRIDIRASKDIPADGLNHRKLGANGKPYSVQADINQRWICRGDALILIDMDQSLYDMIEIPPHLQGKNISASPLPFLFGMSASEMEKRYFMTLGSMHNPRGTEAKPQPLVHVVAHPKDKEVAREWSRADVLLDPGTQFQGYFVPTAIRLMDPTGNRETVYVFTLNTMKMNEARWPFQDPFREPIDPRLKLRNRTRAEGPAADAPARSSAEANRSSFPPPAGRSEIR